MSTKIEYGDFQTPLPLAQAVCRRLAEDGVAPATVIEPTCGTGTFLVAALHTFGSLSSATGVEYNDAYVQEARERLRGKTGNVAVQVTTGDFFEQDWDALIREADEPVLLLGNPPWVTNAALSKLNGTNLPEKSNLHGHRGFEALTGKGNFDISEWMLLHLLEWAASTDATLAFLCKTSVARKVIRHRWTHALPPYQFSLYRLDATRHFDAAVDACLLVATPASEATDAPSCPVYDSITNPQCEQQIGLRGASLVADVAAFDTARPFMGECAYVWRSGLKHDCAKVMELTAQPDGRWVNGRSETVALEDAYLHPLLKSSDVANGRTTPRRWVIVPQNRVGAPTAPIQTEAPDTWRYLTAHADQLNGRKSSVYRNRPPFSIFGIGSYSFAPWKVAISGLYKHVQFTVVGPVDGKPVMLDDTCYFLPRETEAEAHFLCTLLNRPEARSLFHAFIFWDDKRPITIGLLKRLDLFALADRGGQADAYMRYVSRNPHTQPHKKQLSLLGGTS